MKTLLALSCCMLLATSAGAHEVHQRIESAQAVAVHLSYADGKPFAFEAFEAYPDDRAVPAQVGRTDEQGRAVFIPGDSKQWRLKAFSADGHGVDIRFVPPNSSTASVSAPMTNEAPNRASLLLFGVSLLFAGFGVMQLWVRKHGQAK
jgi:nickel transport protein